MENTTREIEIPCKGCLKFPVCRSKERIECTDLFNIIIELSEFERGNHIVSKDVKQVLKVQLPNVTHILPERSRGEIIWK